MTEPVRDTQAMISQMSPSLDGETYHFCTFADPNEGLDLTAVALMSFHEDEGLTLILRDVDARAHKCKTNHPMRKITLQVHSALDGVGLTAAVASELATHDIACNMVAAFHHDHVFVPVRDAQHALALLTALPNKKATEGV